MYAVPGEHDLVFTIDFPDVDLLLYGTLARLHYRNIVLWVERFSTIGQNKCLHSSGFCIIIS